MLLYLTLLIAIIGAPVIWLLRPVLGPAGKPVAALLPAGLFLTFLIGGRQVSDGRNLLEELAWTPSLGINLTFNLDGFSLLFALLVTGIGTLVTIYADAYLKDGQARRFVLLIHLFMAAMLGTVLADNLLVIYLFWEWTSLMSFLLISFENWKPEARQAALQSLLVTAAGGLAMFGGILLLGAEFGTYSLEVLSGQAGRIAEIPHVWLIAALFLAGAFTKSAQAPFHFWLPRAMAAPSPASAYLHSATMVKLGIYLLARLDAPFGQIPGYGTVLLVAGLVTMLVASLNALRATQFKAVLAHSTVASLGILVFLLGTGNDAAMFAMLTFLLAHALYKAALFFAAGSGIKAAGTSTLAEISGLRGQLPLTAAGALLAALSMAGLPPLFGFVAKEFALENLFQGSLTIPLLGMIVVSAVMVAIAWHTGIRPFFAGRQPEGAARLETAGLAAGPLVLGAAGLLIALFPGATVAPLLGSALTALTGAVTVPGIALWHGFTPVLLLSGAVIGLGAVFAWLWPHFKHLRGSLLPTAEAGYNWVFDGTLSLARWLTRSLQNGDQRFYTAIILAAAVVGALWLSVTNGSGLLLPAAGSPFSLPQLVVLLLMSVGALAATVMRGLIATLVSVGIVGFGSATVYLLNGAPDLALTQFAVEALVMVVLMALLLRLPLRPGATRSRRERRLDAGLAAGFGLLLFTGLTGMLAHQPDPALSEYYSTVSLPEAFGLNVVNVILVDFRALDTLGEVSVVGFAAIIIWALFRTASRKRS